MIKGFKNELGNHGDLIRFTGLKVIGELFVFLFPLLIAKFVRPDTYGAYSLSMMIIFFSTTLLLGSSITPFIISANNELKNHNTISRSFTNQLIFFISSLGLIGLIFILFSSPLSGFIHVDISLLPYIYLAFIAISLKSILGNYFLGIDKKIEHTKVSIYYGALLIIFLFILGFGLKEIFLNYFFSSIILLLITLRKINFKNIFPLKYDKEMFFDHWTFTKWQMFGLTAVYFINWGDTIIINYFLTLSDVGIYNLAYQVFKGIISFMYIINTFYLPEISKKIGDREFLINYLFKSRFQLVGLVILGTIIAIFITPYALMIFDESYFDASLILQILLIGVIFKFWSIFYNPLYNVLKRYRYLQLMNIIQIIINIALGILFVLRWELVGVALATTISYFIRLVIDEAYFHLKVKKNLNL